MSRDDCTQVSLSPATGITCPTVTLASGRVVDHRRPQRGRGLERARPAVAPGLGDGRDADGRSADQLRIGGRDRRGEDGARPDEDVQRGVGPRPPGARLALLTERPNPAHVEPADRRAQPEPLAQRDRGLGIRADREVREGREGADRLDHRGRGPRAARRRAGHELRVVAVGSVRPEPERPPLRRGPLEPQERALQHRHRGAVVDGREVEARHVAQGELRPVAERVEGESRHHLEVGVPLREPALGRDVSRAELPQDPARDVGADPAARGAAAEGRKGTRDRRRSSSCCSASRPSTSERPIGSGGAGRGGKRRVEGPLDLPGGDGLGVGGLRRVDGNGHGVVRRSRRGARGLGGGERQQRCREGRQHGYSTTITSPF